MREAVVAEGNGTDRIEPYQPSRDRGDSHRPPQTSALTVEGIDRYALAPVGDRPPNRRLDLRLEPELGDPPVELLGLEEDRPTPRHPLVEVSLTRYRGHPLTSQIGLRRELGDEEVASTSEDPRCLTDSPLPLSPTRRIV